MALIKIIDNCCSPAYLNSIQHVALLSAAWNMGYPMGSPIAERFPKLDIIKNDSYGHPFLSGLALGLLLQIYEAGGQGLFVPDIDWCGISIKDKSRPDIIHSDISHEENNYIIKILGIINSDWKEEWGGGFHHNGTSNYIKPTSFCVFNGSEPHAAEEILVDEKRFAIDFTVYRNEQSKMKLRTAQDKEWRDHISNNL